MDKVKGYLRKLCSIILIFVIETTLNPSKTIAEVLHDSTILHKGTTEKLFVLRRKSPVPEEPSRFKRFLKQEAPVKPVETSTGSVLRRLDEAIQSLEVDKRQLMQQPVVRQPPARSNSLSNYQSTTTEKRKVPARSSSLKISNDVFDTETMSSLSNMDDLQLVSLYMYVCVNIY
jgi:hypothetical protein